jgi:tetratricopeptide (TPR) repeat protein
MSTDDPSPQSEPVPEIIDVEPDPDPASADASSEPDNSGSEDEPGEGRAGFPFEDLFDSDMFRRLKIDVDPERVDESVERLTQQVRKALVRGRYTKVRILYNGKPLMRDIPLGVFVAAEAMSFWYAGLLRALVVNLGVRTVLEVVLVHDADEDVRRGREAYDAGEVTEAEQAFRAALAKESEHTEALYRLGILLRVTGQRDEAIERLEEAARGDAPFAERATEALERMKRGPRTL